MRDIVLDLKGTPTFEDEDAPWFRHGKAWEEEACGAYEFLTDVDLHHVGLIVHKQLPYVAASPDGLVGDDGGVEIKCHKSFEQFIVTRDHGVPARHKAQVQGNLWVSGRRWWDFVGYWKGARLGQPASDIAIVRVERDEQYIARLNEACIQFWAEVQAQL